jgi:hypothetical protein
LDVLKDSKHLEAMMKYSGGERRVPVIVDGDIVSIGYNGKS